MERRQFLKAAAAAGALPLAATAAEPADGLPPFDPSMVVDRGPIQYRKLGKTGEVVSCVGLGGHHIGRQKTDDESVRIIRAAVDGGINFLDNSWDYHDGLSELRMGKALQDGYRKKVFLMTKIDSRTRTGAAGQIDQCLLRLRTDHIDLLQHHEMIRMEDADRVFGEGGAQEAVEAARKAGKVRFVGFTGHKDPLVHLRTIEVAKAHGFHFDTAQMPINLMDAHFRSFARNVVPVCLKEGIAVLGMKSMGDGLLLKSKAVPPIEFLKYSLSLPVSVQITGIDSLEILKQNLDLAKGFRPLDEQQIADLLAKTADAAKGGKYELFKTHNRFDSTAAHPEWLS